MRFTDRHWHARLWGLAWLCVGPIGACEDDEPEDHEHESSEASGSSSSGSSSSRARRSSSSSSASSRSDTVAECKDECDDDCNDCKVDCDEDDEDCNQACDNERYDCRRACEKVDPCDRCDDNCPDSCSSDAGSSDAGTTDAGADDEEMSVTIQFEARVASQAFACGEEYADVGARGTTVTPSDLRLFVQDVKLITSSGKEVPVELEARKPWQSKQVALLDFEDGKGECGEGNPETNSRITGTVPRGNYTGISFSNGVPEKLNHADPTDAQDPLDEFGNLSWGWLGGFRFTKVEVREVTDADDVGCGVIHIGSTACSGDPEQGDVKCNKPNRNLVELDDFDVKSDVIVFDVAEVFEKTDLTQAIECHSTGENCAPMFEAFGVDLEDGKPLARQSVFRVK